MWRVLSGATNGLGDTTGATPQGKERPMSEGPPASSGSLHRSPHRPWCTPTSSAISTSITNIRRPETVDKLFDHLDFQRACQVFLRPGTLNCLRGV